MTYVCEKDMHTKDCRKVLDISSATAGEVPDVLRDLAILTDLTVRTYAVD